VHLDTKLNNRVLDLRTIANHAIFKVQSVACTLFREYLLKNDFIEIHTPKLNGNASEGGASVFKVDYFQKNAYLAQSPQLYKQMMICSDFERVFEIGPVFRAENSQTHRHMTEFIGLDLEMAFNEHYSEVVEVIGDVLIYMFDEINSRCARELEIIQKQDPFVPLRYKYNGGVLRLTYCQGIELLQESGIDIGKTDDIKYLSLTQHDK
jgi:aspartyl-tRNA synthetase